MPAPNPRLDDVIHEHLRFCQSHGDASSTIRSKRTTLDSLLVSTGNIFMRSLTPRHMDNLLNEMSAKLEPSTINLRMSHLAVFFGWCARRRYLSPVQFLLDGAKKRRVMPKDRLRIPASKFGFLLDCATHPRDRIVVALGLYLFLRASEIRLLRVQDVMLAEETVRTLIEKTKQIDSMPISLELDAELRRWMSWYASRAGSLKPDWYLVPAKTPPKFTAEGPGRLLPVGEPDILPDRPYRLPAQAVQRTLDKAGYALRYDDGKSTREGVHTLRRSGARALYDELADVGFDGALRQVQMMLHHASTQMTERYIGVTLDIKKRNEAIRGQRMYPSIDDSSLARIGKVS